MSEIYNNPLGAQLENSVFYLQNEVRKMKQGEPSAVSADLANLKEKINYILQEVLGLEHTLEGITDFGDSSIKTQIQTAMVNSAAALAKTDGITINNEKKMTINNSNSLTIGSKADVPLAPPVTLYGPQMILTPHNFHIENTYFDEEQQNVKIFNSMDLDNPDGFETGGINLWSGNRIFLGAYNGDHFINIAKKIPKDQTYIRTIEISSINGICMTLLNNDQGITFKSLDGTKQVNLPWN
jgi:hypothetical protein